MDGRNYERMEDWGPGEADPTDLPDDVDGRAHTGVVCISARTMARSASPGGRRGGAAAQHKVLTTVGSALEYPDEAGFQDAGFVLARERRGNSGRSLRELALGGLPTAVGGRLSGLVDPKEVEDRALKVVCAIEKELEQDALERYLEMMREERETRSVARHIPAPPASTA
ncbi:hypothetical protein [Streptomyces sp. NPDC054975]